MKKPLMKKPWGAWGRGQLGAGHGWWRHACVDVLGLDLVWGRACVRVAAQQHAFFGFRRSKMTRATMNNFTLPSFAAPGFRRMKMARVTTSTMVAAAAAVVVTNLARGGKGGGRAYEKAVRVGLKGCARDKTCVSWCSRLPTLRLNDRKWGLALVAHRSGKGGTFFSRRLRPL